MQLDELKAKEAENVLKNWFLKRRVLMERAYALRERLIYFNVTGLGGSPPKSASIRETVMWYDLTIGRPEIPCNLSVNSRHMKAEQYLDMFKTATNLHHPCRESGMQYLLCLKEIVSNDTPTNKKKCESLFETFASCRTLLFKQQNQNILNTLQQQQAEDEHAARLWEKRDKILRRISSTTQSQTIS